MGAGMSQQDSFRGVPLSSFAVPTHTRWVALMGMMMLRFGVLLTRPHANSLYWRVSRKPRVGDATNRRDARDFYHEPCAPARATGDRPPPTLREYYPLLPVSNEHEMYRLQ